MIMYLIASTLKIIVKQIVIAKIT